MTSIGRTPALRISQRKWDEMKLETGKINHMSCLSSRYPHTIWENGKEAEERSTRAHVFRVPLPKVTRRGLEELKWVKEVGGLA
jgi:hypothetical protein